MSNIYPREPDFSVPANALKKAAYMEAIARGENPEKPDYGLHLPKVSGAVSNQLGPLTEEEIEKRERGEAYRRMNLPTSHVSYKAPPLLPPDQEAFMEEYLALCEKHELIVESEADTNLMFFSPLITSSIEWWRDTFRADRVSLVWESKS